MPRWPLDVMAPAVWVTLTPASVPAASLPVPRVWAKMPCHAAVMAPLLVTVTAPAEPESSTEMPCRVASMAPVFVTVEAPGPAFERWMPCPPFVASNPAKIAAPLVMVTAPAPAPEVASTLAWMPWLRIRVDDVPMVTPLPTSTSIVPAASWSTKMPRWLYQVLASVLVPRLMTTAPVVPTSRSMLRSSLAWDPGRMTMALCQPPLLVAVIVVDEPPGMVTAMVLASL